MLGIWSVLNFRVARGMLAGEIENLTRCSFPRGVTGNSTRYGFHMDAFEDAGFLHGDGVFETIRVVDGVPLHWERHRARLERGLAHLGIELDLAAHVDPRVTEVTSGAAGPQSLPREERLRISVSRGPLAGEVGRGGPPTVHLSRTPLLAGEPTARLVLVSVTRPGPTALPPWVKPLAYLPFVLARREARAAGGTDALMLDAAGDLSECDSASLFFSLGSTLFTPGPTTGRLEGIMRGLVLEEAARLRIPVVEGRQPALLLERATEIFVTSSLRGLRPVTEVLFTGGTTWRAASVPGPLTRRLMG